VTLHANSIAEALYKNKFESSETPTRTGTVSINCSVYLPVKRWQKQKSFQISAKL